MLYMARMTHTKCWTFKLQLDDWGVSESKKHCSQCSFGVSGDIILCQKRSTYNSPLTISLKKCKTSILEMSNENHFAFLNEFKTLHLAVVHT